MAMMAITTHSIKVKPRSALDGGFVPQDLLLALDQCAPSFYGSLERPIRNLYHMRQNGTNEARTLSGNISRCGPAPGRGPGLQRALRA